MELESQAEQGVHIPYAWIAWSYGMLGDFESAHRWLRQGLMEGHGDWSMFGLRTAEKLEMFGKLAWYWEIVDAMKFPPLQMDHPYFALEQSMRYGRGTVGAPTTSTSTNEPPKTLAVLPFVNMSDDKENTAFFADEHLWATNYDRELTSKAVFSIQAAVATEIAGAPKAAISPETKKLLERLST